MLPQADGDDMEGLHNRAPPASAAACVRAPAISPNHLQEVNTSAGAVLLGRVRVTLYGSQGVAAMHEISACIDVRRYHPVFWDL